MTRVWLLYATCLLAAGACVPASKLVYLQRDDELKNREKIPKDSIIRTQTLNIREYTIQPLDLLSITFETLSNDQDLFDFLSKLNTQARSGSNSANNTALNGILVDKMGEIEYPVLGRIKVGGLTLFEAQDTIRTVAERFMPNVAVRVRMLNFRYTVLGEVNGERTVTSSNTRLTMMEAIGLAGGFGELADRSTVKVVRQNEGQVEIYYVDLLEEKFVESPYYFVQQNDVIIVPPLRQRTFRKYWVGNIAIITATLSFAALMISIFK
jgi:polysaccharide export outer membrane protein